MCQDNHRNPEQHKHPRMHQLSCKLSPSGRTDHQKQLHEDDDFLNGFPPVYVHHHLHLSAMLRMQCGEFVAQRGLSGKKLIMNRFTTLK